MTTLADLERLKSETLDRVSGWSPARLRHRPAPGAWSATEVVDHLVRVERGILAAARRGLLAPQRLGVRDRVGFLFIDAVFRSERRVRVPTSAPQVLPDARAEFSAVRAEWDATRRELAEFVAPLTADQLCVGVFRHPVSGWMSVPQVLQFFEVHLMHHGFQLVRLREATEGM